MTSRITSIQEGTNAQLVATAQSHSVLMIARKVRAPS